jgi:hypothetical protein
MKTAEDLTLDEIKEQLALYQRLYYRKMKETDPTFMERKRELDRKKYERKKERLEAQGKLREPSNRKYNSENLMLFAPART